MPGSHLKSFLMHYEGHGLPHSIAVRVDASGSGVTVMDGATVYKLNMANMVTLREIHCAAVDHSTIVSYWKNDPQDKNSDKSAILLDMVAGARDVPDDSEEDASQDAEEVHAVEGPNKLSFDEDNVPIFNDNILECLKNETSDVFNDLQKKSMRREGRRHCPLCPFRSFTQLRLLRTHIAKHHTNQNQYACSGTKQVKVILALYDHAASSQTVSANLLQGSAAILRQTVQPPLQGNHNSIDKQIRLVFDAAGPKYVNVSNIGSTMQVRRVRNLYYTHSFADLLLREMVLNHAQASRPRVSTSISFVHKNRHNIRYRHTELRSGPYPLDAIWRPLNLVMCYPVYLLTFPALDAYAGGHCDGTDLPQKDGEHEQSPAGARRVALHKHGRHPEVMHEVDGSSLLSVAQVSPQ